MDIYRGVSKLPLQPDTLVRPRVDALLEKGIRFPAMVVAAGTGFGKTQSVASFLERSDYRGVWMQLTMLDNLPMRFWESFVHTVSLHREGLGAKLQALGFPDTLYKYHTFLQFFTEELYVDDQFVVFVFDDFQIIDNPSVQEFFKHFVSAHLENICLTFITRDMDSYSFRSNVHLVTTDDLRFTRDETQAYLQSLSIPSLNNEMLDHIYSYTDGWPIALYLAGLQLEREDVQEDARLVQSQQVVFALLEKEVFALYTPGEQSFWILLSLLNFFPEGLLQRIAEGCAANLHKLTKNNAFVSYDQRAHCYYLHAAFLEFLREKQPALPNEEKTALLEQAAVWCRENAYYVDALDYYDRSGNLEGVWDIIQGFEDIRHPKDETVLFLKYMREFPDAFIAAEPMRRVVYAALLLNNLEICSAETQLEKAFLQIEALEDGAEKDALLGEAYTAAGLVSLSLENFDFVALFKRAAELLLEGSRRWKNDLHLVEYSNALHLRSTKKGELRKSLACFYEGIPYVSKVLHGAGYGLEYLAAAEADFFTANLKSAEKQAFQALYMGEEKQQADITDNAAFLLLRIFLATGDDKRVEDILRRLKARKEQEEVQQAGVIDIALGWFYSEIGETGRVARWILYDQEGQQPPLSMDKETLLRVRCLIEEKKYYEALAVLERLEKIFRRKNAILSMIYAHVYRAIARYYAGEEKSAVSSIVQAYDIAQPNELIMPFIEYGHRTRALFDHLRQQPPPHIPLEWISAVHTKASTYAKRHAYIATRFSSAAPEFSITSREADLLRNLSQGLTREEIAESMYVSPHTVKSMLKTVYSKIGAINSADAIRIALSARLI